MNQDGKTDKEKELNAILMGWDFCCHCDEYAPRVITGYMHRHLIKGILVSTTDYSAICLGCRLKLIEDNS